MKPPVHLYLRARLDDGSYPYLKAAFLPNGHVRPGYAINAGRAVKVASFTYCLRYVKDGTRIWDSLGSGDASMAEVALLRKRRELEDASMGFAPAASPVPQSVPPPASNSRRPLSDCIKQYLAEIKEHREQKTFANYSNTLLSFASTTSKASIEELTREDALNWIAVMRRGGSQPRTLFNHAQNLNIFMRHFGLPALLGKKDRPKYTKKQVRAYNEFDLGKMLGHATVDEADLLYFLLCSGAREQEASFACWSDVDLVGNTYTVTEHIDLGFRPKDKEEGTLPLPDLLVGRLRARRKRWPGTRLIFETSRGGAERHMLRTIKSLALRSGVNCCECINKKGQSCISHPVCKHIGLHKLRKTFATTMHNAGTPARTVQRYLRHSDLTSTLRYLADQTEDQVRATINTAFNGFVAPSPT